MSRAFRIQIVHCLASLGAIVVMRLSFDAHEWLGVLGGAFIWATVATIAAHRAK